MTRKEKFTRRTGVRRLVHRSSALLLTMLLGAAVWTGLAVLAADGDLDLTFDGDGIVTTTFTGGYAEARDLVIQPDGKIVAVGRGGSFSFDSGIDLDFAVARFNTNGSLDTTFGSGGKVTTDLGSRATGVALQSDGKIVAVGERFEVVRYNADGSLDSTFGSGGVVTTAIDDDSDEDARGIDVAVQSDGKIVVVGSTRIAGEEVFAVVRCNADGSLDSTFGSGGVVTTDIDGGSSANAVALQSDGKIVVVGSTQIAGDQDFCVVRYNTNGSLDTTFDSDGIVTTKLGVENADEAIGVALQSDGKIVAVGYSPNLVNGSNFAVIRYNTNGSLDTTFDGDGIVTTDFGDGAVAQDIAIQSDGKIVVAGWGGGFAIARYNTNGSLDTTFGVGGLALTTIGASEAYGVAIQSDGKIVAAGFGNNTFDFPTLSFLSDFALVRYSATGVVNNPPTISAVANSRQKGVAASASTIATVNDADQSAGSLTITVNGGASATVNGVTVSGLVNTDGVISATIGASCTASNASFTLEVTDSASATATATLNVTVTANTPPTLGSYPSAGPITVGTGTTVTPNAAPADNVSVASVTVAGSAGFTGSLSVNPTTGVVTISNAGPVGMWVITVTATDNCGATTNSQFTLNVQTPQQALQLLIAQVNALVPATLTAQKANSLTNKLDSAIKALGDGKSPCSHIQGFITLVGNYINNGTLTPSQGQLLIDAVNAIRPSIGC